jgi:DNA replication protein DnaC/transposase
MSNVLSEEKRQQVLALGRLGWSLRRIEEASGVRRETASLYLRLAGVPVRRPGGRVGTWPPKAATTGVVPPDPGPSKPAAREEVPPDSLRNPATTPGVPPDSENLPWPSRPERALSASVCEPFREVIEEALARGRNARAIWQDLVDDHGFRSAYWSVKRFVVKLRGRTPVEARVVITTAPGEEGQVDYGDGPMVRDAASGKYKRTRLFVLTLGYSRKSVRLLTWKSSTQVWAELHERAFRRLGGSVRVIVLDNLREGVVAPDIYDPTLNLLYRDVLAHYGAVPLPCRVRNPDRKGKVESGVGHAQSTPLKGLRFEKLEQAQAYLDRWEERWADTRIHGTTKRQVAAMFAEEKPALVPLPLEPFRYYRFGERTVNLDGTVEVDAAYYGAPPGWIGRKVRVQWDGLHVRIMDPKTGGLLREHLRTRRGFHRIEERDLPRRTPSSTEALLRRAHFAGPNIGTLCEQIYRTDGPPGVRRIRRRGRRRPNRAGGGRAQLPLRPPLSRAPAAGACDPAPSGPAHPSAQPLPRSHRPKNRRSDMNTVELDNALRKLRLSGMADVLETRLRQSQTENMAPIDLLSALVSDELLRRQDRLFERRTKQARFRDPDRTLDSFDFDFNKKMNRALVYELAIARFVAQHEDALFLGPPGTGKSHLAQAIGRAAILQGYRVVYREAHVLIEEIADASLDGTRKDYLADLAAVPLLIIDDLGMRKLPHTAAEDLLELIMRRYERVSTLLTSNRPVEDWGKLLGDTAAVTALLDRLLHHAHVLKCGPRSWRTKTHADLPQQEAVR